MGVLPSPRSSAEHSFDSADLIALEAASRSIAAQSYVAPISALCGVRYCSASKPYLEQRLLPSFRDGGHPERMYHLCFLAAGKIQMAAQVVWQHVVLTRALDMVPQD